MNYLLYYTGIGFFMNLVHALYVFHRGARDGYVMVPHAMIFFLTIFSWPITLWNLIERTGKGKNND